jgi:hypothetical protein
LPNNAAEIRKDFSYAAASLALQEQADSKEPEIRHADTVGGAFQRFFHLGADAQLVHYLLKLGADRWPNLMSYEFECLGCGETRPDRTHDQIERVRKYVQEFPLVSALCKPKE